MVALIKYLKKTGKDKTKLIMTSAVQQFDGGTVCSE